MKVIEQDRVLAKQKGYTFKVAKKENKYAAWVYLTDHLDDLIDAVKFVEKHTKSHKALVIDVYINNLGYIYWSSKHSEFYGSHLITMEIS
jgi:hypothetical protein